MLDQRLPPNPLALLTGAADRFVGFFAGGVHHIKRHTRHVGDHDGAVGGFTLNLRGARICMRFWPCVALCQEFGGEFRHNIAIFGMDHRDTTQFRQTIEAGEQFIIIHHQGTFIGQKVLERIDTTFFNYTFHLVKHLFAPPCHSHMEGIVAVGTGGFVVPHFQCIMQPLARAGQCEIDDHRCAASQCGAGAAFKIIRGICAHERHLKMGMGINATGHHVAICGVKFISARQVFSNLDDLSIINQNVSFVSQIMRDDCTVLDDCAHGSLPVYWYLRWGLSCDYCCLQDCVQQYVCTPGCPFSVDFFSLVVA